MHYFLEASYPEAHSLKEDQPHRCGRARSLCEGERHAFVTRPIREHARRPQSQGRGPHGLGRGHGGAKGPQLSAGGSSPFGRDGEARAERKRKAKGAARGPCLVLVALVLFGAVRGAWLDRRVPHFDLGVERYLRRLAPRAAPISAKSRAHQREGASHLPAVGVAGEVERAHEAEIPGYLSHLSHLRPRDAPQVPQIADLLRRLRRLLRVAGAGAGAVRGKRRAARVGLGRVGVRADSGCLA